MDVLCNLTMYFQLFGPTATRATQFSGFEATGTLATDFSEFGTYWDPGDKLLQFWINQEPSATRFSGF